MGSGAAKAHQAFTVAPAGSPGVLPGHPRPAPDGQGGAIAADAEPITAIPDDIPVGDMAGQPLVIGGYDLEDSSATLVAYSDDGEPREVLYSWVSAEAEHKLLAAVALDDEHLVATEVTKTVHGRLPLDEQHQLHEQLEKVAKSVNHHLKAGDGIPQHTHDNHAKLVATLDDLAGDATGDEQQMLSTYRHGCDELAARLVDGYDVAYTQGGKVAHIDPYHATGTVTVTELVPAPAEDVPDGLLAASIRKATRIKPTLADDGTGSWNGTTRYTKQTGVEYVIDLGDGFKAVYRPHTAADDKDRAAAGQRGFLEVIAPAGGGHSHELVDRLGQMNLCNRPINRAEAEWTYLQRNIWAQRLDTVPEVAAALTKASHLDDTMTEIVLAERGDQAVGLSSVELDRFARDLRLEAEARALPHKSNLVGTAVAQHLGHPSLDALRATAGYDPTPHRSGGWHTWSRWDVAGAPGATDYHGRSLYHRVSANNLAELIRNSGLLASTERRRVMGVRAGLGKSESADMRTGGSRAVDLRIGKVPSSGPTLVWSDPARLLRRSDWYAYNSDHFAAAVDEGGHSTSGQTRDPATVAGFTSASNEILFRNGIDLLSPEGPDRIVCSSTSQRSEVLDALTARGVTHLAGTPIDEAVTT